MQEVLHTYNGPQYASAALADCSIELGFTHDTSSPHYLQSNGFAESCVRIVKHTLQNAQVQWYKSKDCTAAPQAHPRLCQTSITLSDDVQLQDTYHHTI